MCRCAGNTVSTDVRSRRCKKRVLVVRGSSQASGVGNVLDTRR